GWRCDRGSRGRCGGGLVAECCGCAACRVLTVRGYTAAGYPCSNNSGGKHVRETQGRALRHVARAYPNGCERSGRPLLRDCVRAECRGRSLLRRRLTAPAAL